MYNDKQTASNFDNQMGINQSTLLGGIRTFISMMYAYIQWEFNKYVVTTVNFLEYVLD